MTAMLPLGTRWKGRPIEPVPEKTVYLESGPLRIGVEYRFLNDDVIEGDLASRAEDTFPVDSDGVQAGTTLRGFDTEGLSLHVGDHAGNEYLRFDFFADDPHYHYVMPGDGHVVIMYDEAANGPMWNWAMDCLRDRLGSMLNQAGAEDLAQQLGGLDFDDTVSGIEEVANAIQTELAK